MQPPAKILHVIDSMDLGGAQTVLLDLLSTLDPARFPSEVAVMHGNGVFFSEFEKRGMRISSLSKAKIPPSYLWNFPALLAKSKPDIVHFHLFGSNWIAKPIAAWSSPAILVSHDHCNDRFRHKKTSALFLDGILNRLSDMVLGVSKSTCDFLISQEALPPEKVRLLYNGVNTTHFEPAAPAKKILIRQQLGIPADALVVGGAGRFVAQKNFRLWIECAAAVLSKIPRAFFYLAGDGPEAKELRDLAEYLGLGDRILFPGFVRDRSALYQSMDLLLVTSDYEGLPMNVLEAMACGVPVVASEVDGLAEILTNQVTARLCAPGSTAAFFEAVMTLLSEESRRSAIAEAGRSLVLRSFSSANQARELSAIYEELLGTSRFALRNPL